MKLSFDNLISIKVALQMRLDFLEEEIKKAEQNKNQNNLDFWSERHQSLVLAIQNLQEVIWIFKNLNKSSASMAADLFRPSK